MNFFQKPLLLRDLAVLKLFPSPKGERKGTLILRLDRIGDFALSVPFLKSVLSKEEKNFLVVNELWSSLCQKLFPEAEILPLAPGKFLNDPLYRKEMLKKITSLKVRRLLQPRFYRELFVEELLALAAAPEETLRFQATSFHLQPGLLKLFSASGASEIEYIPGEHELQRNARFAKHAAPECTLENPWLTKPFPLPEKYRSRKYVCVFPGSGKGKICCWQPEKWGKLLNSFDAPFYLITGTPAEKEMINSILRLLPAGRAEAVTDLTLEEFAGVVSHASCALGNDTGGIHLAAMSGVPSLAVTGQGQPGWFLPYPDSEFLPPGAAAPLAVTSSPRSCANCFWRCPALAEGRCPCVAEISVEEVQRAIAKSNFSAFL